MAGKICVCFEDVDKLEKFIDRLDRGSKEYFLMRKSINLPHSGLVLIDEEGLTKIHTSFGEENLQALAQYMEEWNIEPWDVM